MNSAKQNSKMISLCADAKLLDNLRECNKLLEQVNTYMIGESSSYIACAWQICISQEHITGLHQPAEKTRVYISWLA